MRLPVRDDVLCAIVVVAAILLLVMLSRGARAQRSHAPQVVRAARELVGQGVTLARAAEEQHAQAFKLQNCAQAAAFLNAARVLCTDEELVRVSNVDVHSELRRVETAQRRLLARMGKQGGATGAGKQEAAGKRVAAVASDETAQGTAVDLRLGYL